MNDDVPVQSPPQVNKPVMPPPQQPISPGGHEQAPMTMKAAPVTESSVQSEDGIQPAPTEIPISAELEKVGVEAGSDAEPALTEEIKQAGVTVTAQVDPVAASTTTELPLPKSNEDAEADYKRSTFKDGLKWLAALIMYQWRRISPEKFKK